MMSNADVIRGVYAAFQKGDIPSVLGAMAPDIVWNEAENFPYADKNPYIGPDAVLGGVFARLGGEWDGFSVKEEELIDAGDTIVTLGRYGGAPKSTGKKINAQFAHVWKFKNGKIVGFQQYTDTLQAARAMGG
ncbi:MAG: nuclear transport factor 2 family protein [Proteobacteria bacterium]|nr:nuclear transport factor 2 family protein [Pseudomonadota bacterium]